MRKIKVFTVIMAVLVLPGFIHAELINKYTIAELTPSPVVSKLKKAKKQTKRQIIINSAKSLIGQDYWPGGQDSEYGYDCSGLTQYSYNCAGVTIPRVSRDQFRNSSRLQEDEMKPGDLIFFNTQGNGVNHVGIYLGDGEFVHAPGIGRQIKIDTINKPYWRMRFFAGGRYVK